MLSFPNAKINLGLNIVEKRPDGFHNIETIFYPVGLKDALEFVVMEDDKPTSLSISGIKVEGDIQNNLVLKAYHLLRNDLDLPPLAIYLQKHIPLGAGLGGGSADAAFMLLMLNKTFELNLSDAALKNYASKLGSDCPFFIENKPVFASGKGEEMKTVDISLKGYFLVIIKPDIHIDTKEAYSLCNPEKPTVSLSEIINKPIEDWKEIMKNDFEDSIFLNYPEIKNIKDKLYEEGAIYASMSGSGSSVFGIFESQKALKNHFPACSIWQGKLD